jgi:hypothetical protein
MADQATLGNRFVWYEIVTDDVAAARAFYTELLGWTAKDNEMGPGEAYTMFHAGESAIGGIEPRKPPEVRPFWLGYATVDDVDAVTARVPGLGGKVWVEPTDIPGIGRFSIIGDPSGAAIATYKSANPDAGGAAGVPGPGEFVWHELLAGDIEQAKAFYGAVFGWSCVEQEVGGSPYWFFSRGEDADGMVQYAGGMMPQPAEGKPAAWTYYVRVEDVDACAARAVELGGTVVMPPFDVPDIGRVAGVVDPQGAALGLFTPPKGA